MITAKAVLTGNEKRYASNALNYYSKDLEYMVKSGVELEDIQTWLKKRNLDILDYFLKDFLDSLNEEEEKKEDEGIKEVYTPKKVEDIQEEIKTEKESIVKSGKEVREEKYQKSALAKGKKLYPYIKKLLESRGNTPITTRDLLDEHKKHSTVYYRDMMNALTSEGYLERLKVNRRRVIYRLPTEDKWRPDDLKGKYEKQVKKPVGKEQNQKDYWKNTAKKNYPKIKEILEKNQNKAMPVDEVHEKLKEHSKSYYSNIMKRLYECGVLEKEVALTGYGSRHVYKLKNYEQVEVKEESSETVEEEVQETQCSNMVESMETSNCSTKYKEMQEGIKKSNVIPESQVIKGQFGSVKIAAAPNELITEKRYLPELTREEKLSQFISYILPYISKITLNRDANVTIEINCNSMKELITVYDICHNFDFEVETYANSSSAIYKLNIEEGMK